MAAYVLVEVDVTDRGAVRPLPPVGGGQRRAVRRALSRARGASEVLEGERVPKRLVVLEFPDADAARRWYHSPEYQEAKSVREGAAIGSFICVEGV